MQNDMKRGWLLMNVGQALLKTQFPGYEASLVHELWVLLLTLQYKASKLQPDEWYLHIVTE